MSIMVFKKGIEVPHSISRIRGGVEVPDGYGNFMRGGAEVPFYRRAVEWTWDVKTDFNVYFACDYYGNSDQVSSQISGGGNSDSFGGTGICTVTYTFEEPFIMKAGQTIEIFSSTAERGATETDINGNLIHNFVIHDERETYIYTLPNDLTISTITAKTSAANAIHHISAAYSKITIHSDIGSFLLNNSGTSENQ